MMISWKKEESFDDRNLWGKDKKTKFAERTEEKRNKNHT